MVYNKFIVVMNEYMDFSIILARVGYHKNIPLPEDTVCRSGGGWWRVTEDGTLRLYDSSCDFGKYDKKEAQDAFDHGRVYYFDEECIEDFGITKLQLD